MSAITLSLGETHGPAWAARARNTGGSRRPVTKRYRSAYGLGGQFPKHAAAGVDPTAGGVANGGTGGSPARGWRPIPSYPRGGRGAIGWR